MLLSFCCLSFLLLRERRVEVSRKSKNLRNNHDQWLNAQVDRSALFKALVRVRVLADQVPPSTRQMTGHFGDHLNEDCLAPPAPSPPVAAIFFKKGRIASARREQMAQVVMCDAIRADFFARAIKRLLAFADTEDSRVQGLAMTFAPHSLK